MSKTTDKYPDIRFSFNYVKPFANNRELFSKLETAIYNNIDKFRAVDWIHDCRSNNISNLKSYKIENVSLKNKLDDITPLAKYTKDILKDINKEVRLDSDLIKYINEYVPESEPEENDYSANELSGGDSNNNSNNNNVDVSNLIDTSDSDSDSDDNNVYSGGKVAFDDFGSEMKFVDTDDAITYTITPGRLLSYQAVCDLTKAIARSRLTMNMKKDDSIKYAEERERLKLKEELQKYMKLTKIKTDLSSNFTLDIDEMSLKQLQYYSNEAKNMYEKIKTTQIIVDGIDVVDKVQSTVFKNGIKIPGTKKAIKLNNIGGALKEAVFDKKAPLYVAYENLIEKYNLRVSDEVLAGLTLMNTIFKNAEIVDIKDKKESNKDDEDDEDDENDENEESGSGDDENEESGSGSDESDESDEDSD